MKKSRERIKAEEGLVMTPKQKWDNFLFYYKKPIIIAGIFLVMICVFIYDMVTKVTPDYNIGILTEKYLSFEQIGVLEDKLRPLCKDLDGNGKVDVQINYYQLAVNEDSQLDPNTQMASMTRLAGDLDIVQSTIFITDNPEFFHKAFEMFAYKDGSEIPEQTAIKAEEVGYLLTDTKIFEDLKGFEDFRICLRGKPYEKKLKKEDVKKSYFASIDLYKEVTGDIDG